MEMLAYSTRSDSRPLHASDNFVVVPLDKSTEARTVAVIRKTLDHLPESEAELGTTRRKLDHFYASYTRDGSIYLVLLDTASQRVMGGVGIMPFAGLDPRDGIGEIRELAVDPDFRNQGFGLKLLETAFETALKLKYKRLYLETTEHMTHAQALFERFGFRPVLEEKRPHPTRPQVDQPLIRHPGRPEYYVWEAVEPEALIVSTELPRIPQEC